jgi:hypothetical protein
MSICFRLIIKISNRQNIFNGTPLRVTSGLDEVQASMHTVIDDLHPIHTIFQLQV